MKELAKVPGLSFADFELVFEEHLGETWLERIEEFDERIHLKFSLSDSSSRRIRSVLA